MEISRHIVWDWNGTLLDDGQIMMASIDAAFSGAGYRGVTIAEHQRHFRRPISEFFERLAGKSLDRDELNDLLERFDGAYSRCEHNATLTRGADRCLAAWRSNSHTQSLLSMYPHEKLEPLVRKMGIEDHFILIEGRLGQGPDTKASYLRRHIRKLGILDLRSVLLIGDTVDDAMAAQEIGVKCVIYHSGADALHHRDHFADLGVPVVSSLSAAVQTGSSLFSE